MTDLVPATEEVIRRPIITVHLPVPIDAFTQLCVLFSDAALRSIDATTLVLEVPA